MAPKKPTQSQPMYFKIPKEFGEFSDAQIQELTKAIWTEFMKSQETKEDGA